MMATFVTYRTNTSLRQSVVNLAKAIPVAGHGGP
jgi:hypothetical protein